MTSTSYSGLGPYSSSAASKEFVSNPSLLKNSATLFEDDVENFFKVVSQCLKESKNPNCVFSTISIGDNTYSNVTLFHVVYLYWKSPSLMGWSSKIEKQFEDLIDEILEMPQLDLEAVFSEETLFESEHFVNTSSSHNPNIDGFSLELVNIAQYATAIGDIDMVRKVLTRAPDLVNMPCAIVKGKSLVNASNIFPENSLEWLSLEKSLYDSNSSTVSGELALAAHDIEDCLFPIIRTIKVTILHLAARTGDEMICGFLLGKDANTKALDSNGQRPGHYLETSIKENFLNKTNATTRLLKALQPIMNLTRRVLPNTFCRLKREGYDLVYDTRTRVAIFGYQKLTQESFKENASRKNISFHVDQDIPKENRAKSNDYAHTGKERGHLVPAADATASQTAMEDTFLLSNVCPQDPSLNKGYWKKVETTIRATVKQNVLLEVFTGPLFVPKEQNGKMQVTYEVIGKGSVAVPTHFFKVIYFNGSPTYSAFIFPNAHIVSDTPITSFQVTIDRIQSLSGILFNEWR